MKLFITLSACLLLTGCATLNSQTVYYETVKSISRDNTVSQTACWSAISDIAKSGDSSAKIGAIALAEKCKSDSVKIESPKRNWLGL